MTLNQYLAWVLEKLPKDIPSEIVRKILSIGGYVSGLQVWQYGERGPDTVAFTASNENELKHWIFDMVSENIAYEVELYNREKEEKLWRYVQERVEDGHWLYRENKDYIYNAIHDSRKYWMEYHLSLLKNVLSEEEVNKKIAYYESKLNMWFTEKHWSFDKEQFRFVEISNSKEHDTYGIEEPREGSIISSLNL